MAKLSQLTEEMARITGLPHGTVHQTARHLREAGLISSGGRGPGGAEMHFTDARNLLLGLAASQQVKDSPLVVSMLGDARCIDFGNTKGASVLPYDGALIDDKILSECSFGMAVDAILSAMSEGEFADEEGEPFDVAITVSRSNGGVGLSAIIRFQTMHQFMQWDFNASNPDFEGLDSEAANRLARERISSPESAHFEQTTRIGKMMLETLANFIAGANE